VFFDTASIISVILYNLSVFRPTFGNLCSVEVQGHSEFPNMKLHRPCSLPAHQYWIF